MGFMLRSMLAGLAAVLLPAGLHATQAPTTVAPSTTSQAATAPADAAGVERSYRLGTADKVRVIVYNEPTLSGEFAVSDNGSLSLPLIGDVEARGRTPREVTRDITARLGDGYLRDPRVSMDVLTFRPFYILGEVTKPGEYPFSAGLTVMNAVARAEGFTYRANKRRVFIKRAGESIERPVTLSPGLEVNAGDTIRIGERYF